MTPETSMQRMTLITELPSVSVSGGDHHRPATSLPRRTHRAAFVLGLLMLAQGCQSTGALSKVFGRKSADEVAADENKKTILTILDGDKLNESRDEGLPQPTKAVKSSSKSGGEIDGTLARRLDQAHDELSKYYEDGKSSHLIEAHRIYEDALSMSPGNSESHHGLAIVCDLQKDYSSAELHYRAALEEDPRNGKILGDLGYSYVLQGKFSDAETTLTRSIELDPTNDQAVKNLAYVYAKQGDYNLAETTFRKVMNEVEVRNEMVQLFPQGRPDMALEGERGKSPWARKDVPTTDELKHRLDSARKESLADLQDRKSALEAASPETLTIEQQKARIAQLEWERNEALRMLDSRQSATNQQPIIIGADSAGPMGHVASSPGSSPMELRPQNGPASQPAGANPGGGRRVANTFYPQGRPPAYAPQGSGIEQASGRGAQYGAPDQTAHQHALHQTDSIDPLTGRPRNPGIEQIGGQAPLQIPNHPSEIGSNEGNAIDRSASEQGNASFEEAKRRAAMLGLGGPEMMFHVPSINVPQVDTGNRLTPGTGSTWNGGQYPQPQRALPTDAAPHDLNDLMRSPSGQMTVEPNNMGMLNSPAGRSFANPNFDQRLSPQIQLDSPMGNQGLNYVEQTQTALTEAPMSNSHDPRGATGQGGGQYPTWNIPADTRQPQGAPLVNDPRNSVNSSLNDYGQSFRHNPAEQNSNGWNQTPTPSVGLPNQPRLENPDQLMNRGWNQQQVTPRFTPPPYSERPVNQSHQPGWNSTESETSARDYGATGDRTNAYPHFNSGDATYGNMPPNTYATPEPQPIYSPGVRVPAQYGSNLQRSGYDSQGYNGPRITPASR